MRVRSIRLRNFKRFTDLEIANIPDTARLIVVVGPNGSGKSSLFDGLLQFYRGNAGWGWNGDEAYTRKDRAVQIGVTESATVTLHSGRKMQRGALYVRSAYRSEPEFMVGQIQRADEPSQQLRVGQMNQTDSVVSENYRRLIYDTVSGVYDSQNDAKTVSKLRQELIGDLRDSMKRVFDDLVLNNISDPLSQGTFFFQKGSIASYNYKNLSGGEKSAFDLLLDLHIKKKFYPDAIYCIDEIETHLHTRVQGALVREMINILPEPCQLWITTHSLGVLRAAQEIWSAAPGTVSIIDFDGVDNDIPQVIEPSSIDRVTWEKLLSIALDDYSQRIAPTRVVVCEGSSMGNRRKDFDAEIYNRVLASRTSGIVFVSGGSSNQLSATGVTVRGALSSIIPSAKIKSLADRDSRTPREVAEFEQDGNIVLPLRNIESYLFADDVIEALLVREGKQQMLADALRIKASALANSVSRGNPGDDLKSAAGELYVGLKQLLNLSRGGNNSDTFMRDTLAPLIVPSMQTYADLKAAIIDRL